MTTVTISLPDSLKEFIEHEVEAKGYGNVSEYVRELLRDAQQEAADVRLESLLLEGLASGKDIPLTSKFWKELRAEAAQMIGRKSRRTKRRTAR